MDKSVSKKSYFLGLSMGITLSVFSALIIFQFGDMDIYPNQAEIMNENMDLKSKISQKDLEIEKLLKDIEDSKKIQNENKVENNEEVTADIDRQDRSEVLLDINQNMSNSEIADLLVKNNIYLYKNDILMIMEILNFDRYKYSQLLEQYGYISSSYELNKALKEIEANQSGITEVLYNNNLVRHKNSFMKLLYLFDINNSIKYGQKQFKKNSSLREICDILIS